MTRFIFTKLLKNKMLFLALILSVTLCMASACVLPMFNDALQGRMLLFSFNDNTQTSGQYANLYSYVLNPADQAGLTKYKALIENNYIRQYNQPVAYFNRIYTTDNFDAADITYLPHNTQTQQFAFMTMNDYKNNISLIAGRLPSDTPDADGSLEVMLSSDTAVQSGITVGRRFKVSGGSPFTFRVVGLFNPVIGGASSFTDSSDVDFIAVCSSAEFERRFVTRSFAVSSATWDYFLDFTHLRISDLTSTVNTYNRQMNALEKINGAPAIIYSGIDTINYFLKNEQSYFLMFTIYLIPMFFILLLCIFFISKMIVDTDKNEISVLQSRGASFKVLSRIYLLQSTLIAVIPLIAAPFLAMLICKGLGYTTGFLEFGKNIPLTVSVSPLVLLADTCACLAVIITFLIPCFMSFRVNVVERRLLNSEIPHKPFWKTMFLDVLLLLIAAYGYYNFAVRQQEVASQQFSATALPVDPLTFLIMILAIVGLALLFLRFYPFVMKLVAKAGVRVWSAPVYSSLKRVSVLRDKEQFVIFFIVLSIGLSLFSADSARTINQNTDDYILYSGGADMVINPIPANADAVTAGAIEQKPDMAVYKKLKGLSSVSLVSYANSPTLYANLTLIENTIIVGVDPDSYPNVVWSRPDILTEPVSYYLGLLRKSTDACIISETLAKKMYLKVGDQIQINQNDKGYDGGYIKIAAIVSAWPDYTYKTDKDENLYLQDLIIMNQSALEHIYGDVTYEIWAKKSASATPISAASIEAQLTVMSAPSYYVNDYRQQITDSINSASRQSLNALLTLSFIIILLACLIGFMLYWILSIRARAMQFGTLRAMGISGLGIYLMIVWEQVFISLVSAAFAVCAGYFASKLFVNILKVSFGADKQIIPFMFYAQVDDYLKLVLFFGAAFVATYAVLTLIVRRINISKAIKFGEE
jgi:putative ABC transport system permease protein